MAKTTKTDKELGKELVEGKEVVVAPNPASELAAALVQAIDVAKGPQKKTQFTRKINTPWTPKDGSPKLKLKRKMYQHGLVMDEDFLTNEEIALLNKVRPGRFMNGHVNVRRRKDWGIDIDYPVKTAAQRMRLASEFRIRSLTELLERCLEEVNNPIKYEVKDHDE